MLQELVGQTPGQNPWSARVPRTRSCVRRTKAFDHRDRPTGASARGPGGPPGGPALREKYAALGASACQRKRSRILVPPRSTENKRPIPIGQPDPRRRRAILTSGRLSGRRPSALARRWLLPKITCENSWGHSDATQCNMAQPDATEIEKRRIWLHRPEIPVTRWTYGPRSWAKIGCWRTAVMPIFIPHG